MRRSGVRIPSAPPTAERPDTLFRPVSPPFLGLSDSRSRRSEARTAGSPQLHHTETPSHLRKHAGGGGVLSLSSARLPPMCPPGVPRVTLSLARPARSAP